MQIQVIEITKYKFVFRISDKFYSGFLSGPLGKCCIIIIGWEGSWISNNYRTEESRDLRTYQILGMVQRWNLCVMATLILILTLNALHNA